MASEESSSDELSAMEHIVTLNFGSGNCQTGFPDVTALIWRGDSPAPTRQMGSLPGIGPLIQQYQHWQKLYRLIYGYPPDWRSLDGVPDFEMEQDDITNVSSAEFYQLSAALEQGFNHWFNADGFLNLERHLRTQLSPQNSLRVMIAAQDQRLLQLPWSRWSLLEDYPKAEIALSPSNYGQSVKMAAPREPGVKILGVLGDPEGLDLSGDRALLETLPDVEVTFLTKPSWADLNQALWSEQWDVLFFAGHSSSQDKGYIQLNEEERITIEQLKYALKKAIERGLQLAILNSCDGLGLAWELAELKIPQVIAMREPVANRVAQEFLKHFLQAFSRHQTLYLSVREAREKLQPLEGSYGCASWLPVIVQNPAERPPSWRSLTQAGNRLPSSAGGAAPKVKEQQPVAIVLQKGPQQQAEVTNGAPASSIPDAQKVSTNETAWVSTRPESSSATRPTATTTTATSLTDQSADPDFQDNNAQISSRHPARQRSQTWGAPLLAALGVTIAVFGIRWFGGLMPLELLAFDQLMQARPSEGPDPRLLLVTIDAEDLKFQTSRDRDISLSDESLDQLLGFLSGAQVVGLDLYRNFAVANPQSPLVQRLQAPNLIGVCKGVDPAVDPAGVEPPPEMPLSNLGFSDFLPDLDGVLRRQVLSMEPLPGAACRTPYAFATQLILNYFSQKKVAIGFTEKKELIIGDQIFSKLGTRMGGYQNIDAGGNQILINYRALKDQESIAQTISLRRVLQGELDPELLRNRIVLIGGIATINKDFWETPYGSSTFQKIPGVEAHAHVVSQMLSAVLDNRPLLRAWSPSIEGLWILGWATLGGFLVVGFRGNLKSVIVLSGACLVVLTAMSFILLLQGIWVPLIPAAIALPLTATTTLAFRQ